MIDSMMMSAARNEPESYLLGWAKRLGLEVIHMQGGYQVWDSTTGGLMAEVASQEEVRAYLESWEKWLDFPVSNKPRG